MDNLHFYFCTTVILQSFSAYQVTDIKHVHENNKFCYWKLESCPLKKHPHGEDACKFFCTLCEKESRNYKLSNMHDLATDFNQHNLNHV